MATYNTQQVGWIGLGQMGEPMARHLLNSGVAVCVYNRSPEKAKSLVEAGAKAYGSVLELVRDNDIIFLMIADYAAVQAVLNAEILTELKGKLVVNMSTISPSQNQAVEALLKEQGAEFVEAPVSGSSR